MNGNWEWLDQQLQQYCEENAIMGMLRITYRDHVVFRRNIGWADLETRTPFTEQTVFSFYSLSKPFCAIGLLKLKDRGLVELDRHPGYYVPEASEFDSRTTIRQMLQHTSGLPDGQLTEGFREISGPGIPEKAREHVKMLTAYPSAFVPGTEKQYSNINFLLSALVIENVTGQKYADYITEQVLQPLGMKTAMVESGQALPQRATGYDLVDNRLVSVPRYEDWMFGAGDLIGTVEDAYCLHTAMKRGLLLRPETWEEALTPSPVSSMGMGCTVMQWHGKCRIQNNGGASGYRTLHVWLPEDDLDVVFLSNSGFGEARGDIMELIHTAVYGQSNDEAAKIAMDQGYIPQT